MPTGPTRTSGSNPASDAGSTALPQAGLPSGASYGSSASPLAPLLAMQNGIAPEQLVQLLRNLLQMPGELVQLMGLLAQLEPGVAQELIQQLLQEGVPISLEALQTLLQGKMDKAQDKLLKLMQSSQMNLTGSGKDMGALLGGLAEMAAQSKRSPTEALHTTLSLYLPYYPLHPPQAFDLRFEPPLPDEEGGAEEAPQLVLYIQTIALGQLQIRLASGKQGSLTAWGEYEPVAKPWAEPLENDLKSALIAESAPGAEVVLIPRTAPKTLKPANNNLSSDALGANAMGPSASTLKKTDEHSVSGKQSVGIHPAGGVSVLVIHAAYVCIRVILGLDNRIVSGNG